MSNAHPGEAGFFQLLLAWTFYHITQKLAAMKEKNSAAQVEAETAASSFPPGV